MRALIHRQIEFRSGPVLGLTTAQLRNDAASVAFSHEATNFASLTSMMAGGLAYRVGRSVSARFIPMIFSPLLGLSAEVTAFQTTSRLFQDSPESSFSEGWRNCFVDFGMMKGVGHLLRSSNVILQHLAQDLSLVAGHQTTAFLNGTSRPKGSFIDQMLHAEMTNLQMRIGTCLSAFVSGHRIQALERNFERQASNHSTFNKALAVNPEILRIQSTRMMLGMSPLLFGFDGPGSEAHPFLVGFGLALFLGGVEALRSHRRQHQARLAFAKNLEPYMSMLEHHRDAPEQAKVLGPLYFLMQVGVLMSDSLSPVFSEAIEHVKISADGQLSEVTRDALSLEFLGNHENSGESICFIRESHELRRGDVDLMDYTLAFDRYLLAQVLIHHVEKAVTHREVKLRPKTLQRVENLLRECLAKQRQDALLLLDRMTLPAMNADLLIAPVPVVVAPPKQPSQSSQHEQLLLMAGIKTEKCLKQLSQLLSAAGSNDAIRNHPEFLNLLRKLVGHSRNFVELTPDISDTTRIHLDHGITRLLRINGYNPKGEPLPPP